MESNQKLKLIDEAIEKLLAEKRSKGASASPDNDQLLLSKLLSELESSRTKALVEQEDTNSISLGDAGLKNEETVALISAEEIAKELRQVKRQNVVTQRLLTALIVLTVAWQVSEVSLILKLKDGISHPFKSVGSMLLGMFRVRGRNEKDADKHQTEPQANSTTFHMPELPHMPEFPHVDLGSHDKK